MGLDIRIPLGLIFLLIGGLMTIYGLITRNAADIYQKSMGVNLNLTWGLIMFVFGLIMFFYVWTRATLPRLRYDQLMSFGWKFLLPVSLANLVITALVKLLVNRG